MKWLFIKDERLLWSLESKSKEDMLLPTDLIQRIHLVRNDKRVITSSYYSELVLVTTNGEVHVSLPTEEEIEKFLEFLDIPSGGLATGSNSYKERFDFKKAEIRRKK